MTELIAWGIKWISLSHDALDAKILGISKVTLRDSFINCALQLDHAFAAAYSHILEEDPAGTKTDLETVIHRWQNLKRQHSTPRLYDSSDQVNPVSFGATNQQALNEQPIHSTSHKRHTPYYEERHQWTPNKLPPCACDLLHRYTKSFYIVDSQRPPN